MFCRRQSWGCKMKHLFFLFLTIFFSAKGGAIPVDLLFGNQDSIYIKSYHQRQYTWQNENIFSFTKCLPPEISPLVGRIINETSTWGERLGTTGDLMPAVEYYYRKEPDQNSLTYGLRLAVPKAYRPTFQKIIKFSDHQNPLWGVNISSTETSTCKLVPIFKSAKAPFALMESRGDGQQVSTVYSSQKKEPQKQYPFRPVIINAIPVESNTKAPEEILLLSSFNLVFLSPDIVPLALKHEKEFHQLALRLIWNSRDDYTVFYP